MGKQTGQTVVVSFLQYGPGRKLWAMRQMVVVPEMMKRVKRVSFFKIMGTGGGGGYSYRPDFYTYVLLTVWNSHEEALEFESDSKVMNHLRGATREIYSLFLVPIRSRGRWSGMEPFRPVTPDPADPRVVVLTRATIKVSFYLPFWKRVGGVSRSHEGRPGLIFSKGVGERPWIMQATFTVWESVGHMEDFAHHPDGKHFEAVKTTRRNQGFREELYARFQLREQRGTWKGKDPVGEQRSMDQSD